MHAANRKGVCRKRRGRVQTGLRTNNDLNQTVTPNVYPETFRMTRVPQIIVTEDPPGRTSPLVLCWVVSRRTPAVGSGAEVGPEGKHDSCVWL